MSTRELAQKILGIILKASTKAMLENPVTANLTYIDAFEEINLLCREQLTAKK